MNIVPDFAAMEPIGSDPNAPCNTTDEVILQQVSHNIRRGLPQVQPHQINPHVAIVVCGGPSLAETEKELRDAVWRGGKIIATNGSYQWCIDRNLKPSAFAMLDAREFNSRFIATPVDGCKYLLAAQCHPQTFDLCREREVLIWHCCSGADTELEMLKAYYFDQVYPVTGGVTIGLRAISLMRLLGFTAFEIFGLDSCWMGKVHHAYEQPENDRDMRREVWLRHQGRDDKSAPFICSPWHIRQAEDFLELIRQRGDHFRLNVHGNGLLATMLRTGAEIQLETQE